MCESNVGGQFGFALSAAGDLNSDAIVDLIVGAPYKDDGPNNAGAAYVFELASTTLVNLPELVVNGDFEDPTTPTSGFTEFRLSTVSNPFVPGWSLTAGSVDHIHTNGVCSQKKMDLTGLHTGFPGEGPGTITQTIQTEAALGTPCDSRSPAAFFPKSRRGLLR